MSFPTKDAELVTYSTNWNTRLQASAADFALTTAQADQYETLHLAWIAAYDAWAAALDSGNRSKSLTSAKNLAKANLLFFGRQLYAFVQDNKAVSNANRDLLGVVNRKTEPTPGPVPDSAPGIELKSVVGRTVSIRLFDTTDAANRGRPAGTAGAAVFSATGDEPPALLSAWQFEGNTGKTQVDIEFPSSVAPGSKVYLLAFWFNNRKQSGPACAPFTTYLQGGSVETAA